MTRWSGEARRAQREAVVGELEALIAGAGTDPVGAAPPAVAEEIQKLVARLRQGPSLTPADEEALATRFAAARDRAVAAWPDAFKGTDLDPEAGRARREKLLARVESLTAGAEPPASALSGDDLAKRLKEALATNTMGGRAEAEARRRAEADEVQGGSGGLEAASRRCRATPARPSSIASAPPAIGSSASAPRPRARAARADGGRGGRPRILRLTTDAGHRGRRLDDVAREWLTEELGTPPARAAVRRLLMAGALRARGQPLRVPGRLLEAGMHLALELRAELVHRDPAPAAFDEARILHEDDALIAVDKPPGLPTVATADPARPHLVGLVESLLAARARTPDAGPRQALGVHQRLDRDTSGVVVFVKDPAANADLGKQFASHQVEKTYLALTARPRRLPAGPWRMEDGLDAETRPAVTDFEVVEAWPDGALVEARPRTGRKHQIRRHLSQAGMPILGDEAYGGDRRDAPRVMLHAARLQLRHPLAGTPLTVASALPADFRSAIDRLRARPRGPLPGGARRRR